MRGSAPPRGTVASSPLAPSNSAGTPARPGLGPLRPQPGWDRRRFACQAEQPASGPAGALTRRGCCLFPFCFLSLCPGFSVSAKKLSGKRSNRTAAILLMPSGG